jgi:nitrogen regulatory protein PII 2
MNKIQATKAALLEAGYPSMTVCKVLGRGKQKGLQHEFSPALPGPQNGEAKSGPVRFIAKRMINLVVEDKCAAKVVGLIGDANKTGNVGDGKIFVSPLDQAVRIRTGETGDAALL